MKGLCHRCNVSNVDVQVADGLPICRNCMERR